LRCPPALPSSRAARSGVSAPAAVYHNCSGKHAYMLAGCVARGWQPGSYTAPEHPLQAVVADTLAGFAGTPVEHVGVAGCGVPVHAMGLRGLALASAPLGALAAAGADGPAAPLAAGGEVRGGGELVGVVRPAKLVLAQGSGAAVE